MPEFLPWFTARLECQAMASSIEALGQEFGPKQVSRCDCLPARIQKIWKWARQSANSANCGAFWPQDYWLTDTINNWMFMACWVICERTGASKSGARFRRATQRHSRWRLQSNEQCSTHSEQLLQLHLSSKDPKICFLIDIKKYLKAPKNIYSKYDYDFFLLFIMYTIRLRSSIRQVGWG